MKKLLYAFAALLLYMVYGLYLAQYDVRILPEELVPEPPRGFFDYRGVTNVHTQLSSGSGDVPTVIAAALTAGLDFLSVTDLNQFDKPNSLAGYHGNLLVTMDGEYSYLNSRLLNIFAGTAHHLQGVGRSQVLFADLLSQPERDPSTGLLILAHPFKGRYRWTGEYPPGLDGIEIINLKDVWQGAWENNKILFLFSLFVLPFNEKLALLRMFRTPEEELRIYDELNRGRHTVALAGADADSKMVIGSSKLRFPSYETLFSLVRNHVLLKSELTGDPKGDLAKLSFALRAGQSYMSLDILGNPKGFNATMHQPSGQVLPLGSRLKFDEGLTLNVDLPQRPKVPFDVIVYRDGERTLTSNAKNTIFKVQAPGVYRVLVRVIPTLPLPDGKKWIPWIYTNSFYVDPSSSSTTPGGVGTRKTKPSRGGSWHASRSSAAKPRISAMSSSISERAGKGPRLSTTITRQVVQLPMPPHE